MFTSNKCFIILFFGFFINVNSFRRIREDNELQILVKSNERFSLSCIIEESIDKCEIIHPNGESLFSEDLYSGTPNCSIDLIATEENLGKWRCQTRSFTTKKIISRNIYVRKADRLAAVRPSLEVNEGDEIRVGCVTSGGMVPLDGCAIIAPSGESFVVDRNRLRTPNPSNVKYSISPNKSIDRGDCYLTVIVDKEHEGTWVCRAVIQDEEYIDFIQVNVNSHSILDSFHGLDGYYLVIYITGLVLTILFIIFAIIAIRQARRTNQMELFNRLSIWQRFDNEHGKSKELIC